VAGQHHGLKPQTINDDSANCQMASGKVIAMRWNSADIADAVEAGLRRRAEQDDCEQAVYGFDTLDELALHPLIHASLQQAGYGVWPEQRYPGMWHKKKKTEGLRCDVILTPDGLPLRDMEIRGTLFEGQPATDPQHAYWLEIKTVAQFQIEGPFQRYASELLTAVTADVKKLHSDEVIAHSGLLLVLFTASGEIARHDIAAWHSRCLDRQLPVSPPALRSFTLTDRIGNAQCTIAVFAIGT
jgi:hypothetical protein